VYSRLSHSRQSLFNVHRGAGLLSVYDRPDMGSRSSASGEEIGSLQQPRMSDHDYTNRQTRLRQALVHPHPCCAAAGRSSWNSG
jgi:hypothetical protein